MTKEECKKQADEKLRTAETTQRKSQQKRRQAPQFPRRGNVYQVFSQCEISYTWEYRSER